MKKTINIIAVALLAVVTAQAADYFFGSGSSGADVVISAASDQIVAKDVLLSVQTNATVTVYRGRADVVAGAASTSTNIVMTTTATNTIDGVTLTTNDYLIINDDLRAISALNEVSGGLSTTCTVASAVTVAVGDTIYVADDGDKLSVYARTTWADTSIPYLFSGLGPNKPVAISVPTAAGATMVSGKARD